MILILDTLIFKEPRIKLINLNRGHNFLIFIFFYVLLNNLFRREIGEVESDN
jgi:hypothetical protein